MDLVDASNPIGLDRTDPAGQDDIVTTNDLHLPVNKPAILEITSKDVIHDVAIEAMRVAQDAIPGQIIPMWFTPTKTGGIRNHLRAALRAWALCHAGTADGGQGS